MAFNPATAWANTLSGLTYEEIALDKSAYTVKWAVTSDQAAWDDFEAKALALTYTASDLVYT